MTRVACSNCGAAEDVDVAVDGGEWVPYYWDETVFPPVEHSPCCPKCVAAFGIYISPADGEWVRPVLHIPGGAA